MSNYVPISGRTGQVLVNGINYAYSKWTADLECTLPTVTNFNSLGYQDLISAITSAEFLVEGVYNQGYMPMTVNVLYAFTLNWTASININCVAYIRQMKPYIDVDGIGKMAFVADSTGPFNCSIS